MRQYRNGETMSFFANITTVQVIGLILLAAAAVFSFSSKAVAVHFQYKHADQMCIRDSLIHSTWLLHNQVIGVIPFQIFVNIQNSGESTNCCLLYTSCWPAVPAAAFR